MTLETNCAKCGVPLTLPNCDEEGYKAFDMHRFMDRILCQRCTKFRNRAQYLSTQVHKMSMRLFIFGQRPDHDAVRNQIRMDMIPVVAEYLANASQYYKVMPLPSSEVVDEIVACPDNWSLVLRTAAKQMADRSTEIKTEPRKQTND